MLVTGSNFLRILLHRKAPSDACGEKWYNRPRTQSGVEMYDAELAENIEKLIFWSNLTR